MRKLWCVDYVSENAPNFCPEFGPELGDAELVIVDDLFALVFAEKAKLEKALEKSPDWAVDKPEDGKYVATGGDFVYVVDGEVVDQITCAEALGLTPRKFGVASWEQLDSHTIDNALPCY